MDSPLHVAVSEWHARCDKCGEPASKDSPLVVFEAARTPTGRTRTQFHSIYLHKHCIMQALTAFDDMVGRRNRVAC